MTHRCVRDQIHDPCVNTCFIWGDESFTMKIHFFWSTFSVVKKGTISGTYKSGGVEQT